MRSKKADIIFKIVLYGLLLIPMPLAWIFSPAEAFSTPWFLIVGSPLLALVLTFLFLALRGSLPVDGASVDRTAYNLEAIRRFEELKFIRTPPMVSQKDRNGSNK